MMPGPTGVATQADSHAAAGSSATASTSDRDIGLLILPLLEVARRSLAIHDGGVLGIEEPDAGALGVDVVDGGDAGLARRLRDARVAVGHQAEDVAAGRAPHLARGAVGAGAVDARLGHGDER